MKRRFLMVNVVYINGTIKKIIPIDSIVSIEQEDNRTIIYYIENNLSKKIFVMESLDTLINNADVIEL